MDQEPIIKKPLKKKNNKGLPLNLNLLIFVVIVLGLIIAIPYYFLLPGEESFQLQQYKFSPVLVRDFISSIPAAGEVIALEESVLKAPARARVLEINYRAGDRVEAGAVLLRLDLAELEEELTAEESLYREKKNERETRELEYQQELEQLDFKINDTRERYNKQQKELSIWQELYQLGEISRAELEQKESQLKETAAILKETTARQEYTIKKRELTLSGLGTEIGDCQKEIAKLKARLAGKELRFERGGRLVELNVQAGEELVEESVIARIIDEDSLLVSADVDLNDIKYVRENQPVQITAAGETYQGRVEHIAPLAAGNIVETRIRFEEIPEDLRVKTGVSVDIVIDIFKDRLALPRGRYLTSGQEIYVYKLQGDRAVKSEVRFGLINGDYIEVREGLDRGDRVITDSYDSFIQFDVIEVNPEGGIRI